MAAGTGDETMIGRRWRCTSYGKLGTITLNSLKPKHGFWGE